MPEDLKSAEKRYPLTGEIIAVDAAAKTLRVRHDEIVGFMPAMAMDFDVSAGDLAIARPGNRIRAELVSTSNGEFKLERIWPADPVDEAPIENSAKALAQDTVIRGNRAYREVGETVPEFALYDQEGRVVMSEKFRGKQVMLNFIFTRCQVAKMCPAAVARFQQVQGLAREAGVANLQLVSISLDPVYDTPGVLKEYALLRAIDTGNYSFLTGPEAAIRSLLAQFGVLKEFKGNILNHTATTLLIDETGRIIHRADGSTWDVQEFVQKLKRP
ncbi:MAG: SCO family protein [Verrucomicrobia bacterium]|nr:SCO family protein [Verrucomicrobiota bacterium]